MRFRCWERGRQCAKRIALEVGFRAMEFNGWLCCPDATPPPVWTREQWDGEQREQDYSKLGRDFFLI